MTAKGSVTIRRGSVDDLPRTSEVWDRANRHYGRTLAAEHQGNAIVENTARRMINDDADLLVAEVDGKLAGMLLGSPVREDRGSGPVIEGLAHISWVAVEPAYWGRGVATLLIEELLDIFRAKKVSRVRLWTHQDNVRAQRIYERLGFRPTGEQMMDSAGALVIQYGRDI
ncbi:MAG: GNAT family N-acetyltransferase [Candidatus Eremiobacteraeota bacterium]|nr:GNAT family N-acetyltransferase [Candidatus Eremiobacteraeota bacterium]